MAGGDNAGDPVILPQKFGVLWPLVVQYVGSPVDVSSGWCPPLEGRLGDPG